jgi:dynamin GTPase
VDLPEFFFWYVAGTRTVGVISKVDQAASDPRSLAAVNALISGQGPPSTADIPWVALIGQSVSIAAAHSNGEDSLDTAWKAEMDSLKSILSGAPSTKLGRIALVETLSHQIRTRLKQRLPNLLSGYDGGAGVCGHNSLLMHSEVDYFEFTTSSTLSLYC